MPIQRVKVDSTVTARSGKARRHVRVSAYEIINRAVEAGLLYGYNRAFKYSDGPDAEQIRSVARDAIMNELSEVLEFEGDE